MNSGQSGTAVKVWHQVDRQQFEQEIMPLAQPAVLKGLLAEWPIVRQPSGQLAEFLTPFASGQAVDFVIAPRTSSGVLGYNNGLDGFSFQRQQAPLLAVLTELLRVAGQVESPLLAVQSAYVSRALPGFLAKHPMPLLDASVQPRIWIGNQVTVPAHFDDARNLACVVAGRRRFTLYPPEQAANLYIGPLDYAPTGAPISTLIPGQIDLQRYPRYAQAQQASQVAELAAGDVLYIPTLWWHQVESLDAVNILINYWWGGSIGELAKPNTPFDSLLHSLLTMKDLPQSERAAWQAMFNHFVFHQHGDPVAHLPADKQGVAGCIPKDRQQQIQQWLIAQLQASD